MSKMNRACYLLNQNFAATGEVNSIVASSTYSTLVAANLVDKFRRSKKWRSAGYWALPTGGNKLVIKEGVGSPVTITLSALTYTSTAALLLDLKDKLNASVSTALNYDVQTDPADKKTVISADGTFTIISTDVLSQPLCLALGYSITADYTGGTSYKADLRKIHSYETLTIDLGVAAIPQAFILTGERNTPLGLSPQAKIYLQANFNDTWTAPGFEVEVSFDTKNLVLIDEQGLAPTGYRFWRVKIIDQSNSAGYIEFNKIFLGVAYAPERGAVQFPFSGKPVNRTQAIATESGEMFTKAKRRTEDFTLRWDNLTSEEKETIMSIYEDFGTNIPLFFIFDGNGVFSSGSQHYTRMCYFLTEPPYELNSKNLFALNMDLREVP